MVPLQRFPFSRFLLLPGLVLCACGSGLALDVPPRPDLSGRDPELREVVGELHGRLLAAPADAGLWREYAMVLDANELDGLAIQAWRTLTQ